jgi:hypothetical protein
MAQKDADANDLLFGNAVPSVSWDTGTEIRARVVSQGSIHRRKVEYNSATGKYEQGKPLYWDDKKPVEYETDRKVLDPVLTLQTGFTGFEAMSDQADKSGADDGQRRVIVKGRKEPGSLMDAVRDAVKAAGLRKIEPGQWCEIRCTGEGKKANKNMNAPKLYEAVWYSKDNPPAWASEIPTEESESADESDSVFAS